MPWWGWLLIGMVTGGAAVFIGIWIWTIKNVRPFG